MNPRATIFLLALTILAVGLIYYLRQSVPATREAEDNRRYAAVFDPAGVSEIAIIRGQEKIVLQKQTGGWRVVQPFPDRASPEAADRLLMAARFMEVRDRQPGRKAEKFPEAALVPPRLRIELRGEESAGIDIGAGTALPQEVFARVDGQPGILRVAGTLAELASVPAATFRDPRLTEFTADDIEKFTVRRPDGEMTLRRSRGRWTIEKPVQAAADPQAVRAFLDPLLGLRIESFGATAGATPTMVPAGEAAISLTPRGGGEDLELRVTRSDGEDPAALAAFFKDRGGDIAVDGSAATLFSVSPESLRDRSLGYVDLDTVDRIRLEADGKAVTLRRAGDGWTGDGDGAVYSEADIEKLVTAYNETKVSGFRTAESTEAVGLAAPPRRIAFYAWLSENTAEDTAGSHILAGADFGNAAPDGGIYARCIGSEETVTVPADLPATVRAMVFPPARVNSPR
ncbi:MAG: DUF4340 domain-containing protein [Chthoniobacterales bacterium]